MVECGNIAEPDTAARLVSAATATGLPLRGVLHAAAVVEDATLANITDELIDRDWAPKVYGAWHLHQATADQPLDWFCSFSSAAALLGSPGQGAYAAANSWLDAFTSLAPQPRTSGHARSPGARGPRSAAAPALAQRGDATMITPEEGALRVPGAAAPRPGLHRLRADDRNAVADGAGRAQPVRRGVPSRRAPKPTSAPTHSAPS